MALEINRRKPGNPSVFNITGQVIGLGFSYRSGIAFGSPGQLDFNAGWPTRINPIMDE